jgi:hypothetical protein
MKQERRVGTRDYMILPRELPMIVCLCGSTKFKEAFNTANLQLTLAGYIVLSVGSFMHSDTELKISDEQKAKLDHLHKRKIDLADAVLILNIDGYVGHSTKSEWDYAKNIGKPVALACGLTGKLPEDVALVVAEMFK